MPLFAYTGRNKNGELVKGEIDASSSTATASHLNNLGIMPLEITEVIQKQDVLASFLENLEKRKKPEANDLIMFSRQMATLLKAGISILPALKGLQGHMQHKGMAKAITEMSQDLEQGRSLSGSMQKHPHIFSNLYASMINIGENTGQLDYAFRHVYQYLEIDKETSDRVKAALRYPIFVFISLFIAIAVINLFVIPSFSKVFESFGSELPLATKILMMTSEFAIDFWPLLLGCIIVSIFAVKHYLKTDQGLLLWHRYKLKMPILGSLIEKATLARFSRSFAMSAKAGVPITQILLIVSQAVDNKYMEHKILTMRSGLEHGESLTQTANNSKLFTPLVMQMIAVGEESGAVDEMLDEVATFYEKEVDYDTKKLSSAIEPIMITVIGFIVLILALGVFLPMWDLSSAAMN
jgi:MSHA biogenesis protein MshG